MHYIPKACFCDSCGVSMATRSGSSSCLSKFLSTASRRPLDEQFHRRGDSGYPKVDGHRQGIRKNRSAPHQLVCCATSNVLREGSANPLLSRRRRNDGPLGRRSKFIACGSNGASALELRTRRGVPLHRRSITFFIAALRADPLSSGC